MPHWNYLNKLTQSGTGLATSTYTYDYAGARVKLTAGTTTTYYPNKLYTVVGTTTEKDIYAGGSLIASISNKTGTTTTMIHPDHLGSTNVVSNASGTAIQYLTYNPYGDVRSNTQTGNIATSSALYTDSIQTPWTNQSWNSVQTNASGTVHTGTSSLKQVYNTAYSGLSYTRSINTTPYATFDLAVYVGTSTPDLYLYFTNASGTVIVSKLISTYLAGGYLTNTWQKVSIPLSDLGLTNYNNTLAFNIESSIPGTVYYDHQMEEW